MSTKSKCRCRTAWAACALLALALWLLGTPSARAQGVRPAPEPIVNSRLQRVVETIPDAATDLPPYLVKPQDVYLLVTAGASYTDIQVLANPEVNPQTVARALLSALPGTSLRGKTVEWSADRYSAAQVSEHHSRFGAMRTSNTVPIAPLMVGLRRAALTPHLLLRVPRYAQNSLPPAPYSTKTFHWYDAEHLAGRASVTVVGTLSPVSLALPLSLLVAIPVIGFVGLWLAGFLSRRGQRDEAAQRQLFRSINGYATASAVLLLFAGEFALFRSPVMSVLADLWAGSSTTVAIFTPFLVASALILPLLLLLARRQEIRRFGPSPAVPALAIPMSDEEKAVRKRADSYSRVPHLIGAVILAITLFAVPRRSPLYPLVHPIAIMLPMFAGLLTSKLFSKRLDRFTQKTLDDDLTWQARQIGQVMAVRMPDVYVEDSSRAAHLAFASHQGHHITLSRKMQETFTPAETDFVLAHHLACMKRRTGGNQVGAAFLPMLLAVPLFSPMALFLWSHNSPGAHSPASLILSPWLFAAMAVYLVVFFAMMIGIIRGGARQQAKKLADADRAALEATDNLAAAESALEKFEADTPPPTIQANNAMSAANAETWARVQAGRISVRRAALQKTAQALGLAPAPGAEGMPRVETRG